MFPEDISDQFMRYTADAVLHCPDPAGHERFVRQLADADMTRRIERNHRLHFGHWIIFAQQRGPKLGGGKGLAVAQHFLNVVPARHCEALHRLKPFDGIRSEEHTSELQSLMRTSYAVFCLKKKNNNNKTKNT